MIWAHRAVEMEAALKVIRFAYSGCADFINRAKQPSSGSPSLHSIRGPPQSACMNELMLPRIAPYGQEKDGASKGICLVGSTLRKFSLGYHLLTTLVRGGPYMKNMYVSNFNNHPTTISLTLDGKKTILVNYVRIHMLDLACVN